MDYLVLNYMKSMANNMLNARLNELKETPQPPFIYAVTEDGNFFLSKTKDAFTGIAVSKEDGIDTALSALAREIERVPQFGLPPLNTHVPKRIICANWNQLIMNVIKERVAVL